MSSVRIEPAEKRGRRDCLRLFLLGLLVALRVSPIWAQSASTSHVYPQFVDGDVGDGTFYRSTLFATNATKLDASCSYQLYGVPSNRLMPVNSFTIPGNGGVLRASTSGTGAFAGGYLTMTCDQTVYSYLQYEHVSNNGSVLGTASVYSTNSSSAEEFIFPTSSGYRLGVAIANDSGTASQVTVRLGGAGGTELQTSILIGAHSRIAQFIDEMISIPAGFTPVAVLLQSSTTNPVPFTAVGLIFSGAAFSTVPPLVFGQ
jgi:hypothetical protein